MLLGVAMVHKKMQPAKTSLLGDGDLDPPITKNENDHLVTNDADREIAIEIVIGTAMAIEAAIVVGEAKDMNVIETENGHEAEASVIGMIGVRKAV